MSGTDDELDILRARVGALELIGSILVADRPEIKGRLEAAAETSPIYEHGRNQRVFRNNYRGTFLRVVDEAKRM